MDLKGGTVLIQKSWFSIFIINPQNREQYKKLSTKQPRNPNHSLSLDSLLNPLKPGPNNFLTEQNNSCDDTFSLKQDSQGSG